jgi:hypothetical protein
VEDVSTIAACTENHDFRTMLANRASPSVVAARELLPKGIAKSNLPSVVNTMGSAASANGNARADRLST